MRRLRYNCRTCTCNRTDDTRCIYFSDPRILSICNINIPFLSTAMHWDYLIAQRSPDRRRRCSQTSGSADRVIVP